MAIRLGAFAGRFAAGAAALLLLAAGAALAGPEPAGDQLRLVIILSRHGVRAPLQPNADLQKFAADPWPAWESAPAIQTPEGDRLVSLMGDYYRERFTAAGLLTGDAATDGPLVFVRADNDQRTIQTGRLLGKALVPGAQLRIHAFPEGEPDGLFQPYRAHVARADPELASSAILGRIGGDPKNLDRAYAPQFAELDRVLWGAGSQATLESVAGPTTLGPGRETHLVDIGGSLLAAEECIDSLILEYTDGKPEKDVGWGRVDEKTMTSLLTLHELFFDLVARTFYPAQAGASNLASHILDTLEQAAGTDPVPGAIGPPGERVVVVVGHDSNLAQLGGLLGLHWCIPGTQPDPTLPGSALLFELWKGPGPRDDYYVRLSYVSQDLAQLRSASALSLASPPARAPVYIPGCSGPGPTFDAPLPAFVRQARKVIAPGFVADDPASDPDTP
jgi:4-phytase/acid phosphatase